MPKKTALYNECILTFLLLYSACSRTGYSTSMSAADFPNKASRIYSKFNENDAVTTTPTEPPPSVNQPKIDRLELYCTDYKTVL